jgi:hypothetical protein
MDAWCAPHSRSAELTSNTSKTRHQKRSAETGGRNGDSIAEFRTRRPAHICDSSRYRAVFERPSYVTRWRRTGWLGRRDSNLCIRNLSSRWLHCCCACIVHTPAGSPAHDLLSLFAPHDSVVPNRARFLMRRFESCPTGQSVSNASHMKVAKKTRGTSSVSLTSKVSCSCCEMHCYPVRPSHLRRSHRDQMER